MTGYKIFNPDWTCRGFQYKVGEVYSMDDAPVCCSRGFHFCNKLSDCFEYYSFNPDNKAAEIEALGEIVTDDEKKHCTNKIRIVREIEWKEVLEIVNEGVGCSGLRNTGNRNAGDCNTGNCNTGDWNTGNCNTGNCNTGDCNTGNWNTGNWNTGDWNTGDWNTGDWNAGNRNTGNSNTGNCNTGDCNTGNCNTGDWNTGDWNECNYSNGVFNTKEPKISFFDKPSEWTYREWFNSNAKRILNRIPRNVVEWIYSSDMSEDEKKEHPEHETTGGYLKILDESECAQIWWDSLSEGDRDTIRSMPNFDKEIFERIVGIKI